MLQKCLAICKRQRNMRIGTVETNHQAIGAGVYAKGFQWYCPHLE